MGIYMIVTADRVDSTHAQYTEASNREHEHEPDIKNPKPSVSFQFSWLLAFSLKFSQFTLI